MDFFEVILLSTSQHPSENLYAMIFPVTDHYISIGKNAQPFNPFELTVLTAPAAKHGVIATISPKYLHPVVSTVRHYHEALVIDGNAAGKLHLASQDSRDTERKEEVTVDAEDLYSVVAAVTDIHLVVRAHRHIVGVVKVTCAVS